ncbi:hypothetical protein LTR50_007190 [Elasticomyces elasticus]|nr:hypothetical protein LTR50_007190 [Elasticomyces elasticus]
MPRFIPNYYNLACVIFVALGSCACSYGQSIIGSTIGQPSFYTSFNLAKQGEPGYSGTSKLISAMNGVMTAGSIFGTAFTAWFADKWGRRVAVQIGTSVMIVGIVLVSGSVNMAMFLIGRFIAGFGIGNLMTIVPLYQAEISTPEQRGFMVCMHGVMVSVGYTGASWIGFGCYFAYPSGDSTFPWRFPLAFNMVPNLVLLVGSFWLPSSPRWLLGKGREDEAFQTLRRLHRTKDDPEELHIKREFYQMKAQLEYDKESKQGLGRFPLFSTAHYRKRAALAFLLMFGNEFTGVLVIANYGVLLYTALGLKTYVPLLLAAVWVTIAIFGNFFAALYLDRVGRRLFLLIGLGGICITNTLECVLQARYLGSSNLAGQRAAVFFIFMFIVFWSGFCDATQYTYIAEIFPTATRAEGVAFGTLGYYFGVLITLIAGPIALDNLGWRFFIVLIACPAAVWLMVFFFLPETKGKSLEDINEAFGDKVAVHYQGASKEEDEQYWKSTEHDLGYTRGAD